MNTIEPKKGSEARKGLGMRAAATAVIGAQTLAKQAAESKFLVRRPWLRPGRSVGAFTRLHQVDVMLRQPKHCVPT